MSDTIEYIDAYFNQELEGDERQRFEDRCISDEAFAGEVAFYLSARSAAREALLDQKIKGWQSKENNSAAKKVIAMKSAKKRSVARWIPYVAAACLILVIASFFLLNRKTPQSIASNYIKTNYTELNQYMDGDSKDSVQMGIAEYNNKNYSRALILFEWAASHDSTNYDAIKYAGLTYLQNKNYDKALQRFKELSAMKSAFNAGDILQASTLLQRNAPGDEEAAKQLLQKVVKEKEEGSGMAEEALDKWYEDYH